MGDFARRYGRSRDYYDDDDDDDDDRYRSSTGIDEHYEARRRGDAYGPPSDPDPLGRPGGGVGSGAGGGATTRGRVQDRMRNFMANAKQDPWKVIVVKATNRDVAPPKGKHVKTIMDGLESGGDAVLNRETAAGAILYHLQKRTIEPCWIVVAKALAVLHYTLRASASKPYRDALTSTWRSAFEMDNFQDENPEGFAHAKFIKAYGRYLTQWSVCYAAIQYPPMLESSGGDAAAEAERTFPRRFVDMKPAALLTQVPQLIMVLDKMFGVDARGVTATSPVVSSVWALLAKDLGHFWVSLAEAMTTLADAFPGMLGTAQARKTLDLHRDYADLLDRAEDVFADWAKVARSGWTPPRVTPIPRRVLDDMEDQVLGGGAGRELAVAPVVHGVGGAGGRGWEGGGREAVGYGAWQADAGDRRGPGRARWDGDVGRRPRARSPPRYGVEDEEEDDPFAVGGRGGAGEEEDPFLIDAPPAPQAQPDKPDPRSRALVPAERDQGRGGDAPAVGRAPRRFPEDDEEGDDPFGAATSSTALALSSRRANAGGGMGMMPQPMTGMGMGMDPRRQQAMMQQQMLMQQQQMQQQQQMLQQQMMMNQMNMGGMNLAGGAQGPSYPQQGYGGGGYGQQQYYQGRYY